MKFNLIIFFTISLFYGCEDHSRYTELMEPAIKIKLADKNPNPVFDGEIEPPIPAEEVILSNIKGPDKNKNGIRDDIDIWINRSTNDYNYRMALRQIAKANQQYFEGALENRFRDANKLYPAYANSRYCLIFFGEINTEAAQLEEKMLFLNFFPKNRSQISYNFSKNVIDLGGGHYDLDERYKFCDFKIKNLEGVLEKYNMKVILPRNEDVKAK